MYPLTIAFESLAFTVKEISVRMNREIYVLRVSKKGLILKNRI